MVKNKVEKQTSEYVDSKYLISVLTVFSKYKPLDFWFLKTYSIASKQLNDKNILGYKLVIYFYNLLWYTFFKLEERIFKFKDGWT